MIFLQRFRAHDHTHPLSEEIYDEVKRMTDELVQHGHRFDPAWLTRLLGEHETIESVLCGHSEKLAIAFHFIRGRRPSFIQVTKNLRICGDCRELLPLTLSSLDRSIIAVLVDYATKLIAKIRQCDIVVRDSNRIHHFGRNGICSCEDHF